jgi:molybdopterin synthase sulfur carrier subunit
MTTEPHASPTITVLYFAAAATATGLDSERIPVPIDDGIPFSTLPAILASRHPNKGLGQILATSQWSVNEEMVDDLSAVVLKGGEEVAVICPVSGG